MTRLTAFGTLTASDDTSRTLTYRLLPFGEPGRTSRGIVTASAASVTIPPDVSGIVLNIEHEPTAPVGRAVSVLADASGLVATFRIAATRAGDDLLVEAREGLRPGVSVELDDVVIRGGALVASSLVGAGAVVAPAYPSALLVASDTEPDDTDPEPDDDTDDTDDPAPDPAPTDDPATEPDETEEIPPMSDTMTAAAAPAGLPARTNDRPTDYRDFIGRMTAANAAAALGDSSLLAALTDVGKTTVTHMPDQWVGQLWQGAPSRRVIPLLGHKELSGLKVTGWRWKIAPAVAEWAGDKAAVPSPAATTEAVEVDAKRLAGAHDIPREHRDFQTGFIEAYYEAMTASYGVLSDDYVAATLLAGATKIGAQADPLAAILAGALEVGKIGVPTFALLASDKFATLAGTKQSDAPAFLDLSLSFSGDGGGSGLRVVSVPTLAAGTVMVGDGRAATVHELPGVPIRAEALDMVKGGVDAGVFGYCAVNIHDPRALNVNTAVAP
jgi:hypothetical protein